MIEEMNEEQTYNLDLLSASYQKWNKSPGLKLVYGRIYSKIGQCLVPGQILELGSGIGIGKEFIPSMITRDITKTAYVEKEISCYEINKEPESWSNLVAVDVLHHLRFPFKFFKSAASALKAGGRIILAEPAATLGGILFYSLFHHEPIKPKQIKAPFHFAPNGEAGEFANMGMGSGLFVHCKEEVKNHLSSLGLQVHKVYFFDFLAYPFSGGYSKRQMAPTFLIKLALLMENALPQVFYRLLGLRMIIVLEKL